MIHQGEILKRLIKSNNFEAGKVADELRITRVWLYQLYKKQLLPTDTIRQFCRRYKINQLEFSAETEIAMLREHIKELNLEIKILKNVIKTLSK